MTRPMPRSKAPDLAVETLDGPWNLADRKPENFTMVVFYRGLHCPACKGFLGELERLLPEYAAAGTDVIAVSMDPRDRAEKTKAEWGLSNLSVGYGLTEAQARDWGLYLSESIKEAETQVFSESGLYLIDREGKIFLATVASMPWPRPDIAILPSKIRFALDNGYPARGNRA